METRDKDTSLIYVEWILDLAFLTDVREKINKLDLQLQCNVKKICDMLSIMKAFSIKTVIAHLASEKQKISALLFCRKYAGQSERSIQRFKCVQVLQPLIKACTGVC
ncbi:unnamed protein product [Lepeophtheirus salmonis]|uniref:(salmon louse) hypothetical protein n=1 Tax=Lepeophtheirus salmonis TaxID=72036 RepID=A0A7R8CT79_LEPSM|nr:unnamed protein product [Lepeophtheirus salmonis]CAF2923377.1 unnamed protein product [Lepeophtheirus salmonis]